MEQLELLLQDLKKELSEIKSLVGKPIKPLVSDDWIPREDVMEFFNYGNTQIAAFQKSKNVVIAKVGKRVFFNRKSLLQVIEDSKLG